MGWKMEKLRPVKPHNIVKGHAGQVTSQILTSFKPLLGIVYMFLLVRQVRHDWWHCGLGHKPFGQAHHNLAEDSNLRPLQCGANLNIFSV